MFERAIALQLVVTGTSVKSLTVHVVVGEAIYYVHHCACFFILDPADDFAILLTFGEYNKMDV